MRFTKIFALGALVALSMNGVAAEEELKAPMDGVQEAKITLNKDFIPADCTAEAKKSKAGNYLHVHYTGFIDESSATGEKGKQFDSSLEGEKPEPFTFSLGEGQVVAGWEEGLADMCVGEKRTLVIPPELGYGEFGAGEAIPGGATLKFTVELVKIEDAAPTDTSLFDEIDTDDDKKLSLAEIKTWLTSSQELDDKLAQETAESTLSSEDFNKDGFVDLKEFMSNKIDDDQDDASDFDMGDVDRDIDDDNDKDGDGKPDELNDKDGDGKPDVVEPVKTEL